MRKLALPISVCAVLGLAVGVLQPLQAQNGENPHGQTRLTLECKACHTTQGWRSLRQPLDFDHSKQTRFQLAGRHANVSCGGCHLDLRYDQPHLSQNDCASCHLDVHQGRQTSECGSCHNTVSFRDASAVDQHTRSRFPLTGAHVQISCESCHRDDQGGAFTPLTTECFACHQPDYTSARSVDHVGSGLPRECRQCHGTAAWYGAAFDHASAAHGFTLLGAHASLMCATCHGQPGNTLRFPKPANTDDCMSCHRPDYDRVHTGSGYPTICLSCHTNKNWATASFNHEQVSNGFALQGAHVEITCASCHGPNNTLRFPQSAGPDDCVACHRADYDREHTGSMYPLTCLTCHTNVTFAGATFAHDAQYFPINSGTHAGKWTTCQNCHPSASDYKVFTCLSCHEHNQTSMDDKHKNMQGYAYNSATCMTCHPRGTK